MNTPSPSRYGTIHINLLGEFSVSVDGWDHGPRRVDNQRRSKRLWAIIAYLVVNRASETPAEKLIEIFWPDSESDDPLRALWLAISRCRSALADLGVPDARNLILAGSGSYRWNPERPTTVDVERFEALAASRKDETVGTHCLLEAVALYKGDFWAPAVGGSWALTRQLYYKTLFLQVCQEAVEQLWQTEQWENAADICRQAVAEEPGAEQFSVYFMRALTAMGQPQKALEHYTYIKGILKDDYMVELSDELELARSEAAGKNLGGRLDAAMVEDYLKVPEEGGAFFCDYPVFRRLVELEARELHRSGRTAQIVLLDVFPGDKDGSTATDMKRMERTLLNTLREGDPFTRLSAAQYLILLPGAAQEDVEVVMTRVETAFRRNSSHSRARLRYHTISLEQLQSGELRK